MHEKSGQERQAPKLQKPVEAPRYFRHGAILNEGVDLEEPSAINHEQAKADEEQQPLEQTRFSMPQNQRQQEQIDQRPRCETDEPNVEE
jgi:hypothetical protein